MYPASWGVKAALGNLQISDDDVKNYHHEGIPYQYICDMRDPGGSSFIEVCIFIEPKLSRTQYYWVRRS